ncbi:MAG: anthranilate synthase component 1 [Gammaproteobacteria bacterium]|nr:anthranilate synthase component 1 [Gammaproteobacteria bacterium]
MMTPIRPGAVRSLTRRLDALPAPHRLFAALTDNGRRTNTLLLESAEPTSRKTQRSILVLSAALSLTSRDGAVSVEALNANGESLLPRLSGHFAADGLQTTDKGFRLHFPALSGEASEAARLAARSPLSVLRELSTLILPESAVPEAVFLAGGFAYDFVARYEPLPDVADDEGFPDFHFLLADELVVIDHLKGHGEILVNVFGGASAQGVYYSALDAVGRIADCARRLCREQESETGYAAVSTEALVGIISDQDDGQFRATVEKLQAHIVAGDVFQIVPSRRFRLPCADAFAAYESLRALNPSPYLFYANFGDSVIFGASPESAVKVDGRTRQLAISPIAGTRPRGLHADGSLDADLDSRYEAELRLDEKENAEHMMLVDLARNDVARVSKPGTRHVAELLRVDRYSHVMHLVSRVVGELKPELDALHAYQASMNMGTLTGAPKVRAMQLLREHGEGRRGHYGGAIGYLRGDGSFDTAIMIRSARVKNGIAEVRAGAGVVHDSQSQAEADETRRKAEAVLRAIARANALVEECAHG